MKWLAEGNGWYVVPEESRKVFRLLMPVNGMFTTCVKESNQSPMLLCHPVSKILISWKKDGSYVKEMISKIYVLLLKKFRHSSSSG